MKHYTYAVEGRGIFPEDMLRYDEARFASKFEREIADEGHAQRRVKIEGARKPMIDRWQSFGWTVTDIYRHVGTLPDAPPEGADTPASTIEAW